MVDDAVNAADLANAVAATTDVLTVSGIGTLPAGSGSGPANPPGGIVVDPSQLPAIALDAQARTEGGHMSLATFADDLFYAGVLPGPAGGGDTSGLGVAAQQLLASWLSAARADPAAPDTAPIFALAQLAADQTPAVDLSDPTSYQPQDLQLG